LLPELSVTKLRAICVARLSRDSRLQQESLTALNNQPAYHGPCMYKEVTRHTADLHKVLPETLIMQPAAAGAAWIQFPMSSTIAWLTLSSCFVSTKHMANPPLAGLSKALADSRH